MKTFTLRVLKGFHDRIHDVKREKKSTFEETDEERAKDLIKKGYAGLLSVTPSEQPKEPTKSEKYVEPVERTIHVTVDEQTLTVHLFTEKSRQEGGEPVTGLKDEDFIGITGVKEVAPGVYTYDHQIEEKPVKVKGFSSIEAFEGEPETAKSVIEEIEKEQGMEFVVELVDAPKPETEPLRATELLAGALTDTAIELVETRKKLEDAPKPKKKRKKRKDSGTQSNKSQPEQGLSV